MEKQQIVIIVGPTASGKSALAQEIARRFNGAIISADSMQIYRGLDVGTAKETAEERAKFPHYLLDVVDKTESFSVAEFKKLAEKAISDIVTNGELPIVVGGTGLYIEALLNPFSFGNTTKDETIRKNLLDELEQFGAQKLYEKLMAVDEVSASKLHPNDVKRVVRALEIYYASGKTKSEASIADENAEDKCNYNVVFVGLNCDREKLYERINARVEQMFLNGLKEEIETIYNQNEKNSSPSEWQSMQAIGYKEFFELGYFDAPILIAPQNAIGNQNSTASTNSFGNINANERQNTADTINTADDKITKGSQNMEQSTRESELLLQIKEKIKKDTRNYAKRQLTWFRRYKNLVWFDCLTQLDDAVEYVSRKIGKEL